MNAVLIKDLIYKSKLINISSSTPKISDNRSRFKKHTININSKVG